MLIAMQGGTVNTISEKIHLTIQKRKNILKNECQLFVRKKERLRK